jgi:hypothetical protein
MRVAMCFVMSMAAASAAEVPSLGLSAEPGDIRFAFAEAAVAEGGTGPAASIVCDRLAERLSLCFTFDAGETRRYVTEADLVAWGIEADEVRRRAGARAKEALRSERPASTPIEGGLSYLLSAEGDGLDAAALAWPRRLEELAGGPVLVAVPQRHTLLAWRSDGGELDTIMAVGVRRMHDAAPHPVSPLVYRHDGEAWRVWGQARPPSIGATPVP